MPTECAESGCVNQTDSGICPECAAEQKYGTTSRAYDADGSRVELREGETRDDSGHSSAVNETLANADAADLETAGIDPDDVKDDEEREVRTDGGQSSSGTDRGTIPPENYELWDEEREQLRCPFCDGRILRIGRYGECTDCGERFQKDGAEVDDVE